MQLPIQFIFKIIFFIHHYASHGVGWGGQGGVTRHQGVVKRMLCDADLWGLMVAIERLSGAVQSLALGLSWRSWACIGAATWRDVAHMAHMAPWA